MALGSFDDPKRLPKCNYTHGVEAVPQEPLASIHDGVSVGAQGADKGVGGLKDTFFVYAEGWRDLVSING